MRIDWNRYFIALLLSLSGGMSLLPPSLQAATEEPCHIQRVDGSTYTLYADDGTGYRIDRAVQLSEAIPESRSPARLPVAFHAAGTVITVERGERVLLSGAEVSSGFATDDELTILSMPNHAFAEIDFRKESYPEPLEITTLFSPGRNTVTLEMIDRIWPTYSSSAYWLLILTPCIPDAPMPAMPTTVLTAAPTATTLSSTLPERISGTGIELPDITLPADLYAWLPFLADRAWLVTLGLLTVGLVWSVRQRHKR